MNASPGQSNSPTTPWRGHRRGRLRYLVPPLVVAALAVSVAPVTATAAPNAPVVLASRTVASGETWTVSTTTRLGRLTVESGGTITAPDGYSVTLTVNGVETGQRQVTTAGTTTTIQPGTYRGRVVLTVTTAVAVTWPSPAGTISFPLRQAIYADADGVASDKSVTAAVRGGQVTDSAATGVNIASTGEGFNGVWVAGGSYRLDNDRLALRGNGRYDFVGAGAAVVGTGSDTRLVVDHADINNTGAVRTGLVASDGSNVIVKNSTIATHDGTLPSDYEPTLFPGQMRSAPWMLGVVGNVRATNLVGSDTKATYINSAVSSTGWGVLSTDSTDNGQLTAINTSVTTGKEGYGTYADGQTVTDRFLGSRFDVDDYAAISTGGDIHFGDSDKASVAALNDSLDLQLTKRELAAIRPQASTIRSGRFGVMWHGGGQTGIDGGTVTIDGHTTLDTAETTFVDKGLQVALDLDGSDGARVKTGNGVLWQLMDSDDPGPVVVDGALVNQGVYTEPTGTPDKVSDFDVTTAHDDDAVANLTDIKVKGSFYNSLRAAKNLVLNLDGSSVTGVVSSSTAKHAVDSISAAEYRQISEVTNTVGATVNNGVIVSLTGGSTWNVTGTSYLSRLEISDDSTLRAACGHHVVMTVDGVRTTPTAGTTYTGAIVLTLA